MVTTQVVLELSQSCVVAKIATEVFGYAVVEVVKPDLVDVVPICGLGDVNLAFIDWLLEVLFISFSPGLYGGGISHGRAAWLVIWLGRGCYHFLVRLACAHHTITLSH
jgi:hypothetical protein